MLTQNEPMSRSIEYTTRRMEKKDLRRVLMLMKLTAFHPPPEDIIGELFTDPDTTGVVAETIIRQRPRIIAHMFISLHEHYMVMQDCVVHTKYRRMGIGNTLVRYAKKSTAFHQVRRLINHVGEYNLGGQLFLQDQGFVCSGQEDLSDHTFLNMEWTSLH
jgi:ribosomal protein S18 acetylase RimI-like enzyme